MVVISFVHIVLFRIHEEKSVADVQKILLKKFAILAAQGYKEITLLGQNVNAYGKDFEDINMVLAI